MWLIIFYGAIGLLLSLGLKQVTLLRWNWSPVPPWICVALGLLWPLIFVVGLVAEAWVMLRRR